VLGGTVLRGVARFRRNSGKPGNTDHASKHPTEDELPALSTHSGRYRRSQRSNRPSVENRFRSGDDVGASVDRPVYNMAFAGL
jgi:hypothetical protein